VALTVSQKIFVTGLEGQKFHIAPTIHAFVPTRIGHFARIPKVQSATTGEAFVSPEAFHRCQTAPGQAGQTGATFDTEFRAASIKGFAALRHYLCSRLHLSFSSEFRFRAAALRHGVQRTELERPPMAGKETVRPSRQLISSSCRSRRRIGQDLAAVAEQVTHFRLS
jgi:hypothetical protein